MRIYFFVTLRCLQLRKFLNGILILIIVISGYNFSLLFITTFHNNVGTKNNTSKIETAFQYNNTKKEILLRIQLQFYKITMVGVLNF